MDFNRFLGTSRQASACTARRHWPHCKCIRHEAGVEEVGLPRVLIEPTESDRSESRYTRTEGTGHRDRVPTVWTRHCMLWIAKTWKYGQNRPPWTCMEAAKNGKNIITMTWNMSRCQLSVVDRLWRQKLLHQTEINCWPRKNDYDTILFFSEKVVNMVKQRKRQETWQQ